MKKVGVNAIYILIMLCILITSGCTGGSKTSDYILYELSKNAYSPWYTYDGEKYSIESYYSDIDMSLAPMERTINFHGKTYDLTFVTNYRPELFIYDVDEYYCEDEGVTFAFRHETGELVMAYQQDEGSKLFEVDGEVEEENYRAIAVEVLKDYIPVEEYECTCSTRVEIIGGGSIKSEYYDGFVTTDDAPAWYSFSFQKRISGYLLADAATVILTNDNKMVNIKMEMIGDFEEYKDIAIDSEKIDEMIDQKIKAACNPDIMTLKSYETDMKLIIGNSGELLLWVEVTPEVESKNPEEVPNGALRERCVYLIKIADSQQQDK